MERRRPLRHRRWRYLLPVVLILLLLALIEGIRLQVALNRLAGDARAVQAISQGAAPPALKDLDGLLVRTGQDIRDLRGAIGPGLPLLPLLSWVPKYGGTLANAPALLEFAENVTATAEQTLRIGQSINAELDMGASTGSPVGASLLKASLRESAEIKAARLALARAMASREALDSSELVAAVRAPLETLDRWLPVWKTGLNALELVPAVLNSDRPRTYLLVAQNSDEIRPIGGFISGVAELWVERGSITVGPFQDSYAVDDPQKLHPSPPPALATYMSAGQWYFRDSNWSPDFATSAKDAESIYLIDRGVSADGVIAFDNWVAPALLDVLGPVSLPDGQVIDATNVLDKMHEYWGSPQTAGAADRWEHRKDFVGTVLQAMIPRLLSGEYDRMRVAQAFAALVNAKHLIMYFNDVSDEVGQAGSLIPRLDQGAGDALMVVDSNVGFNKVGPQIERRFDYAVSIRSETDIAASLTITYTNHSQPDGTACILRPTYAPTYAEMQQGCYWNYVRLLVPRQSELISVAGDVEVRADAPVGNRAVFSGYLVLPRGATRTVRVEYRLPPLMTGSGYALHLESQPGVPPVPTDVRISYPATWHVASASPAPDFRRDSTTYFAVTLDHDQDIQVRFEH